MSMSPSSSGHVNMMKGQPFHVKYREIIRRLMFLIGALLGLAAAILLALAWARYGHLINMKLFFQVTSVFLVNDPVQAEIYTFHEFAEAGVFPNSEVLHTATEAISPDGKYGQWFSLGIVILCAGWLGVAYFLDRFKSGSVRLSANTAK